MLYRDLIINSYLCDVFFKVRLPTSDFLLKYYFDNIVILECNIYLNYKLLKKNVFRFKNVLQSKFLRFLKRKIFKERKKKYRLWSLKNKVLKRKKKHYYFSLAKYIFSKKLKFNLIFLCACKNYILFFLIKLFYIKVYKYFFFFFNKFV